jgi:sugar/nucleoside kinase (ribokinase family)
MARVVVIGSVAEDEVLTLPDRLREGAHVDAARRERRLGGGGANTAVPLVHAGHEVILVAPLGTDERGDWLLGQLQDAGVDTSAVVRVEGESTRSVVLVDPRGERTIVNVHRCREGVPPRRLTTLEADALYVRSREPDLADVMASFARRGTVLAHVPPLDRGARPAHVLVGSESDLPPAFVADPWDVSEGITGGLLRWVVLTMGGHGAEAISADERIATPAPSVKAVDTTAAGDAFAAGLVHALLEDQPLPQALENAVAWGAAAVTCRGMPGRETVARLLRPVARPST